MLNKNIQICSRMRLGGFKTTNNAVKARKRGKEMHDEFLEWYYSRNENSYECTVNKTEEYPLRSRANHSAADF